MIEVQLKELRQVTGSQLQGAINELAFAKLRQIEETGGSAESADEAVFAKKPRGYIDPNSTFSVFWNLAIILCIYIFLIQIGFIISFGSDFWLGALANQNSLILFVLMITLLVIDIPISFRRGFYRVGQGKVESDTRLIIDNYLKGYFIIDAVTSVAIIIPFAAQKYIYDITQIVFLLKFAKKGYYETEIYRTIQHRQGLRIAFSLLLLGIDTIIITHFVACAFIAIDRLLWNAQYFGNNTLYYWLSNNSSYGVNLLGGAWYIQYIYGQQYSAGTFSTLAPGPFPKNPIEVGYVIMVMSSFIVVTSYLADGVVKVFFSEELLRVFHETNIQAFDNFLKLKKVSQKVKNRVQNYFQMVWEVEGKLDSDFQKQVIDKLSTKLKYELRLELIDIKVVKMYQYFPKQQLFIKEIVLSVEEILTDSNQLLFEPNQYGKPEKKLYQLTSGMVRFYFGRRNLDPVVLGLSNLEKIIGVYEFITNQDYYYSAETVHITHFYTLSNSAFAAIINNLQLQEHFTELKHRVLFNSRIDLVDKRCLVCVDLHLETTCPKINISSHIRNEFKEVDNLRNRRFRRKDLRHLQRITKPQKTASSLKKKNSLILQLENLFPLGAIIESLLQLKNEEIDVWAQFSNYFVKDNLKSIRLTP